MTCHNKLLATAALLLVFAVWATQAVNYYKQNSDSGNYSPPHRSRPPSRGQAAPSNALWIMTRDAPVDTMRYRTPMDRRMVPSSMLYEDRDVDKRLIGDLLQSSDERRNRYRKIAALFNTEDDM